MERPKDSNYNYHELNAMLNLYGPDGKILMEFQLFLHNSQEMKMEL